jgi:hypothetical protein
MKKTSRLFLLIALICTLVFCAAMSASALEAKGKCGDNVSYTYDKKTGELIISGKGDMYDYDGNEYSPFYKSDIESVTVKKGVTRVGSYAFEGCDELEKATITDTVKIIGGSAFYGCEDLETIKLPKKLEKIGAYAFKDCSELKSVTFSDTLKSIGGAAFYGCSDIKSIIIPDSVTAVGSSAFCSCLKLETVEIGKSVKHIGLNAFSSCDNIESLTVDENNKSYISEDGALLDMAKTKVIRYSSKSTRTEYNMPDSVTEIGEDAFSGSIYLEKITLSDNLEKISIGAFGDCSSLKSIAIPEKVTRILCYDFLDCSSLEEITVDKNNTTYSAVNGVLFNKSRTKLLKYPEAKSTKSYAVPETVTHIYDYAFYNAKLEKLILDENVESIGDCAFESCDSLRNIIIPGSMKEIGGYAFIGCANLSSVRFNGTRDQWNQISFGDRNEDLFKATIEFVDDCNCHKTGFMGVIYKVQVFFWKLFKSNPVCVCGIAHY